MCSDTDPKDLPPSEVRYAPNVPAALEITNLTVKDLGDIVEAEYEVHGDASYASVTQQIERTSLPVHVPAALHAVVESYLKQNLK